MASYTFSLLNLVAIQFQGASSYRSMEEILSNILLPVEFKAKKAPSTKLRELK
jgi:hypothetical protein